MKREDENHGTVRRVIGVLRHLAEMGETTIKETSSAVGLVPSTCHRMLDLLVREGMVHRDPVRRNYRVGAEFSRIAALVQSRHDIRLLARPFLQHVVEKCDETCVLCLYLPTEQQMIFAERIDSSQLLRYQLPMNTPLPLLWGASGRAILAYMTVEDVDAVYTRTARAPASGEARPSRKALSAELSLVRKRGYAVSHGQKIRGAVGINSPVFDAADKVIGSFGVTVPEQRILPSGERSLGILVREHADQLSRALGATRTWSNAD